MRYQVWLTFSAGLQQLHHVASGADDVGHDHVHA